MKWFKALWNEAQYVPKGERFWWLFLGFWSILSKNTIVNMFSFMFLIVFTTATETVEDFLIRLIFLLIIVFFINFQIANNIFGLLSFYLTSLILHFVENKIIDAHILETSIIFLSLFLIKYIKNILKRELK